MTTPTPTTWATVADVKTYTGLDVTAAQLTIASGTVDMAAGRTYGDVARIGNRDQYWLKLALCYQSAWLAAQFDAFQRMDIDSLGQNRSITKFNPNAVTLGPFTKKALKRVSWLKSRSLHIQSPFTDGIGIFGTDPMSPGSDGLYAWTAEEG
jgi:hypothetical protein